MQALRKADHERYAHPRYEHAPELRRRSAKETEKLLRKGQFEPLGRALTRHGRAPPRDGDRRGARRAGEPAHRAAGGLDPVEPGGSSGTCASRRRMSSSPSIIRFGSEEVELLKSARRLGIPTGDLRRELGQADEQGPAQVRPRPGVRLERSAGREAIELHGIPPDRVRATGATSSTSGSSGARASPRRVRRAASASTRRAATSSTSARASIGERAEVAVRPALA